ncbi:class I SAM-dependent methyltransferase [Muricoccus radiodurans]|uniref:class I SAM-dependent methyltransferase n=1 Tax=Muricoccus radiodurans TaxID=2231721 RepID=UPI003CEDE811
MTLDHLSTRNSDTDIDRITAFQDASDQGALTLYDIPALYDAIVQPGPCEAFYLDEARRNGGPVLELACGTGRLTLPLARAGCDVVGLDSSSAMLAAARRKAGEESLSMHFIAGDMRDFDLRQQFALVVVSCNSLAHLLTAEEVQACLTCVRRHLAPGGVLAFDVVLPKPEALIRPADGWVRLDTGPNPSPAVRAEERASYDPVAQIRTSNWRIRVPDAADCVVAPLSLRQFFPQELPLALAAAGLQLVARYGDFARNPLNAESLNQICLASVDTRKSAPHL